MANMIAVVGITGTGKTQSILGDPTNEIEGLKPEETLIINVSHKPLAIKNSKELYRKNTMMSPKTRDLHMSSGINIAKVIKLIDDNSEGKYTAIKNIVVDDAQYIQMFVFMDKIQEKNYDKFNDAGEAAYLPLKAASDCKREDLTIIFTYHPEMENGQSKIKTAGKVVDAYLTIEGMFPVVLYTKVIFNPDKKSYDHFFITKNDGVNTAKSPTGMFDSFLIPNDMGLVLKKYKEYYG